MDIKPQSTPERIESSITSVTDSQGDPVPPDTITQDTVLTLSGSGKASSIVFIFDDDVLLTPASVTINRTWNFTETVALGRHVFTVRDELGGVDSPEWGVTVGEATVVPEIIRVVDGSGSEISNGGTTEDGSTISVYGTALPNQQVELFDYTSPVGTAPVDLNGDWMFQAPQVGAKTYSITAKGVYGSFPVSPLAWVFTVEAASPSVAITNVRDSEGNEIEPGGTTSSTSLILTGTAMAGQAVQIYDGETLLRTETAGGGIWTCSLPPLTGKEYRFKARGLYGNNPESSVWRVTIVVRSGFEDFEAEIPRVIPFTPPTILRSGLRLKPIYLSPNALQIVRGGSSQGEHGFQYLYLNASADVELTLPDEGFRVVKFTAWSSIDTPQNTFRDYCVFICEYSDGTRDIQRPDFIAGVKVVIMFAAPSGATLRKIGLSRIDETYRGTVACDSFIWSE
ncbi:hypothetical protein [Pseudomonas syringae group sp. J309-1]|uniref:hypothetical protein n=1 Tax=Pseudomonas syringae group sp. J309-1 TaxID=3079588 RepID=UPI002906659C|nr:hypothetical protein [Pseudomonas syringae group sp. J309-1]MDU8362609.1 hypothetical protein [Pseudomonas syringae group sp. J309-1]